jgi:spermidine synthase
MERVSLGRASTPQQGRIELVRENGKLVIYVDDLLLMTSGANTSEIALAEVGCRTLGPSARVLVGGLGLGYTLRAVLDLVPSDTEVVCVELLQSIVRWHREGPLGEPVGDPVRDPRVVMRVEDIVAHVRGAEDASYDSILLDVDNGPIAMTMNGNGWLYTLEGLAALYARLRPGGSLVVWSADPQPRFVARLAEAGYETEVHTVPAGDAPESAGVEHVLLVGRKPREADTAAADPS